MQLGAAERHRGRPQKETVPKTQAEPAVSERCGGCTRYQKFLRVGVWFARLQSWLSGISRDRRRCGMRGRGGGRRCESGCRAYCFAPRFSPQASAPSRASLPAWSSARPLAGRDEKPRRPPAGVPPASSTAARKGGSAMRASPFERFARKRARPGLAGLVGQRWIVFSQ